MNIIARKPTVHTPEHEEYIVIDRGAGYMPFVSATASKHSLDSGEWYWGHYFRTREEAMAHFNGRS